MIQFPFLCLTKSFFFVFGVLRVMVLSPGKLPGLYTWERGELCGLWTINQLQCVLLLKTLMFRLNSFIDSCDRSTKMWRQLKSQSAGATHGCLMASPIQLLIGPPSQSLYPGCCGSNISLVDPNVWENREKGKNINSKGAVKWQCCVFCIGEAEDEGGGGQGGLTIISCFWLCTS